MLALKRSSKEIVFRLLKNEPGRELQLLKLLIKKAGQGEHQLLIVRVTVQNVYSFSFSTLNAVTGFRAMLWTLSKSLVQS